MYICIYQPHSIAEIGDVDAALQRRECDMSYKHMYKHIYTCVCVCIYIYIYIYI